MGRHVIQLVLATLALSGCAGTPAREVISTPSAPAAIGPYSQAVRAGDAVYVSGQLGLDPATGQLVAGGVEAEARQALDNCKAILAAAGMKLADVVQVQVFLADMNDYKAVNAIYAMYFSSDSPARAAVQVARLPRDARIEILVTAVRTPR